MDTKQVLARIKETESPLKKQLLTAAVITALLEERDKAPVMIGGCALSYDSREVLWSYLERKAAEPPHDTASELKAMREKGR